MSEQITQHPHLEQYPDAIQDVEQAQKMAIAGDYYETVAAEARQTALDAIAKGAETGPLPSSRLAEVAISRSLPQIKRNQMEADKKYAAIEGKPPHDITEEIVSELKATKR